jgi:hypothetical protein
MLAFTTAKENEAETEDAEEAEDSQQRENLGGIIREE